MVGPMQAGYHRPSDEAGLVVPPLSPGAGEGESPRSGRMGAWDCGCWGHKDGHRRIGDGLVGGPYTVEAGL